MIYVLMIVLVVAGAGVLGSAVYGFFKRDGKELGPQLNRAKAQLRIAEGGLRKIANGISGSPELDAQNTLEDISNHETKELL